LNFGNKILSNSGNTKHFQSTVDFEANNRDF